jgi:hypothetical protein
MAKNTTHDLYSNEQDSVPRSSAGTGTLTTSATDNGGLHVVGVGTNFQRDYTTGEENASELTIGDWIYIKTQNEFAQVVNIVSDTELTLDTAFTTPLAGVSFDIVKNSKLVMLSYAVDAVDTATVDGVVVPANTAVTFTKSSRTKSSGNPYIDPIDIDCTGNANTVLVITLED